MRLWFALFQRSLLPDIWYLKKLPRRMMDTLFLARASKLIDDKSLKCEVSKKGSHLFKLAEPYKNERNFLMKINTVPLETCMQLPCLAKMIKERVPKLWDSGLENCAQIRSKKNL